MKKASILVVDDELDILESVQDILEDEGYQVTTSQDDKTANQLLSEQTFDLILLDIWMPTVDGISLLKAWVESGLKTPVVMMSGHATIETAVEATRLGAYDFLEKPLSLAKLISMVKLAIKQAQQINAHFVELPVGKSQVITHLKNAAKRIATADANVLISGEVGSGKKTFAHYIHSHSRLSQKPLRIVAAASIIQDNIDVELFGSDLEKPTFVGLLERAQDSILVFDEVGSLTLDVQEKLVAVLNNRSFLRVGGTEELSFNGRIIALSQLDLLKQVAQGLFRQDLYYLLAETTLAMENLSKRLEDLPEILNYYVDFFCQTQRLNYRKIPLDVQNYLKNFPWRGHLAQVKNLVKQLLILGKGDVTIEEVKAQLLTASSAEANELLFDFDLSLKSARDRFDKHYFQHHLKAQRQNLSKVADIAGIERTTLYRRLKQLDIKHKKN